MYSSLMQCSMKSMRAVPNDADASPLTGRIKERCGEGS
jgi:hypothetical protein